MIARDFKKKMFGLYFYDEKEEAAKLIKDNIATVDFDDDDDLETIFDIACCICNAGDLGSMEVLTAQEDFDINMRIKGETLMTHLTASLFRNFEFLKKVIELGGDITTVNRSGDTVFSLALKHKVSAVSRYLAQLQTADDFYMILDAAAIMLQKGFDINTACADRNANSSSRFDYKGKSALHIACAKGLVDSAKFLVRNGADVNLSDIKGGKPLFYAVNIDEDLRESKFIPSQQRVVDRHIKIIRLLCENKADINTVNDEGEPPLLAAVNGSRFANGIEQEYEKIAGCLIECGAKARISNLAGQTPLHFSVLYAFKEIAKQLIALNADVNAQDRNGRTPMHYAVSGNKEKLVSLLIKNGADKEITDNQGVKPLDIASEKGYVEIVEMLI